MKSIKSNLNQYFDKVMDELPWNSGNKVVTTVWRKIGKMVWDRLLWETRKKLG